MIGVFTPPVSDEQLKALLPNGGGAFSFYRIDLWDGEGLDIEHALLYGKNERLEQHLAANGIPFTHVGRYDGLKRLDYAGKRVALIGPAPHVMTRSQVAKLSKYDIIARVNFGYPVSPEVASKTTDRTDVWYTSLPIARGERMIPDKMPPYIKTELAWWEVDDRMRPHMTPLDIVHVELDRAVGCRTNRGLVAIADILAGNPAELYITGMTFYRWGAYYPGYLPPEHEKQNAIQAKRMGKVGTHDPSLDLAYFARNFAILPNVKTDKELSRVLSELETKNARP